jgi:hypothetical protein
MICFGTKMLSIRMRMQDDTLSLAFRQVLEEHLVGNNHASKSAVEDPLVGLRKKKKSTSSICQKTNRIQYPGFVMSLFSPFTSISFHSKTSLYIRFSCTSRRSILCPSYLYHVYKPQHIHVNVHDTYMDAASCEHVGAHIYTHTQAYMHDAASDVHPS